MKLCETVQPECSQGPFPMENNTFFIILEYNGQFYLKMYLQIHRQIHIYMYTGKNQISA